jgi:cellulose synthase/poly-beta-1,6-N-acetylglucosamine synthase-like glycosyltransferase
MIFWISIFSLMFLLYIYLGYFFLLKALDYVKSSQYSYEGGVSFEPMVTVILAVFNESEAVISRIENILECNYPNESLEILVASDGSSDETNELVSKFNNKRVKLVSSTERLGKSGIQNLAVKFAKGSILIFTDADTRFSNGFIKEIVEPLNDPGVGGVDGHLLFNVKLQSGISQGQSYYWSQELKIRTLESNLELLAVSSGACLAVRRTLFRHLNTVAGEDCLIPLDVLDQGYSMIHASKAIAYDQMPEGSLKEFQARSRMTQRNWSGVWMYPNLLNPFLNPKISLALWSHKILRWLSPVFLIIWLSSSFFIFFNTEGQIMFFYSSFSVIFLILALVGLIFKLVGIKNLVSGIVYGFFLANIGFFVGIVKALLGKKIVLYK